MLKSKMVPSSAPSFRAGSPFPALYEATYILLRGRFMRLCPGKTTVVFIAGCRSSRSMFWLSRSYSKQSHSLSLQFVDGEYRVLAGYLSLHSSFL